MPEFFSHLVDVSKSSMDKMRKGLPSMVKKIGSGIRLDLSPENHAKAMRAYKRNKGVRLKLTAEEIQQNEDETHGSGFFKFLNKNLGISRKQFNKGTKAVAKVVAPLAEKVLPQIGEQAGQAIGMYATKSPIGGVAGAQFGKQLGYDASNALKNYGGSGFRVAGAGFRPAGMIGSGIATLRPDYLDGYSNILPVNHPIYINTTPKINF
jgi:hypothetical protein